MLAPPSNINSPDDWRVEFDVGGRITWSTVGTLKGAMRSLPTSDAGNFFETLVSQRWANGLNVTGPKCVTVPIDRQSEGFHWIVDYLRRGTLPSLQNCATLEVLAAEADFFGLKGLQRLAELRLEQSHNERAAQRIWQLRMHSMITDIAQRLTGGHQTATGSGSRISLEHRSSVAASSSCLSQGSRFHLSRSSPPPSDDSPLDLAAIRATVINDHNELDVQANEDALEVFYSGSRAFCMDDDF